METTTDLQAIAPDLLAVKFLEQIRHDKKLALLTAFSYSDPDHRCSH